MNRPTTLELQHFWIPPKTKRVLRPEPSSGMPHAAPFTPGLENELRSSNAATHSRTSLGEGLHSELTPNHADVASRDTAWTPNLQEVKTTACSNIIGTVRHLSQVNEWPSSGNSTQAPDDASLHRLDTISQNTERTRVGHDLSLSPSIHNYPIDPLLDNGQNAGIDVGASIDTRNSPPCEEWPDNGTECLSGVLLSPSPTSSCDASPGQRTATFTPPPDSMSSETDCPVFDEWPLQDALLKRVIIDGVAVLQLQFEWPLCATHAESSGMRRKFSATHSGTKRRQTSGVPSRRSRFTPQEDTLLRRLKETSNSWREIHRQFSAQFPGRTTGALQVHYCTKLKGI